MVDNAGYLRPFVNGTNFLYGVGDEPRTLTEQAMVKLSAKLRAYKDWWRLYQDGRRRQCWFDEALETRWKVGPPNNNTYITLSRNQIDYVLDELSGYATLRDESNGIQVSCFDRIWETDALLSSSQHDDVMKVLNIIRINDLQASTGYCPRRVVVDPCRYSLIYGRTYGWPEHKQTHDASDYTVSLKFAALPTNISISSDGRSVRCLSYINNVDPALVGVYPVLETVLGAFIPLFERVLTDLHRNNPLPQRIVGPCRYVEWDEPERPEDSDDEDAVESYLNEYQLWEMTRPIELPDVPKGGYNGRIGRRRHQVSLQGREIQLFYKMTDIHLTPDNSVLALEEWHVEGMKNERIVACAFYVCTMENISTDISFRMAVTSPRGFPPGDAGAALRTWGMRDGDACNQHLGTVPLRTGLSIAFPNIYQHRFGKMCLFDDTRGGRMTVLGMYLVDPDAPPVVSTAGVAPQQREWTLRALHASLDHRIPSELVERIVLELDSLMTVEEADEYAKKMRLEWETFQKWNDSDYFSLPFDIWSSTVQHL